MNNSKTQQISTLLKRIGIILLFPLYLFSSQNFAPIMLGDITFFVPYSKVSVSLGADKTIEQGNNTVLVPSITNSQDIVSYSWTRNGTVVSTGTSYSIAGLSAGTHTIILTITDINGLKVSSSITVTVEDAPDELNNGYSGGFVGTTKGEFSVNKGTANYNLKIDVPPGIAGMEPKLSLGYSSSGGNGYMGVGWNIGGISTITRCPQTKASDGANHKFGVNYDTHDRFCLDGQRLILVSGSYGGSNSEYRTEINNYSKVIAHDAITNGTGGGPKYFTVKTKSGLTYTYNASQGINYYGAKKFWKVSSIKDTYNNTITFSYYANSTAGEHYLNKVTYAGNEISYIYDTTRSDKIKGYQAGYPYAVEKRLNTVIVKAAGSEVRRYTIAYSSETLGSKRSKVSSIREQVPQEHLKTLYFSTSNGQNHGLTQVNMSLPFSKVVTTSKDSQRVQKDKGVQFADMNGDGLNDIVQLYIQKNGTFHKKVCLNTGTTFNCSNTFTNTLPDVYFSNSKGESMGTRLADINGDGLPDIIQLYDPDSDYYGGVSQRHVWLNTGSGFTSSTYDNTLPYVYFAGDNGKDRGTRLADMNGDGRIDIVTLYISSNGSQLRRVYLNTGSGFSYNSYFSTHLPNALFSNNDGEDMGTRLVDMNGDGLTDIMQMYRPNSSYYGGVSQRHVWINTGTGFVSSGYDSTLPATYLTNANGKAGGTRLADINGDGLPDIVQLYLASNGVRTRLVYLNNGKKFNYDSTYTNSLQYTYFNNSLGEDMGTRLVDMNADGLKDIVQIYLPNNSYYNGVAQRHVYLNNGKQFVRDSGYSNRLSDTYITGANGQDMGTQFTDVNGDGITDILQLYTPDKTYYNGISQKRVFINQNNKIRLTRITNATDQTININYKYMSDSSVYYNYSTNGRRNTYLWNKIANDNIEVTLPQALVYSVNSNNGIGGTNTLRYKYYGYILNKERGSQGFHAVSTYDDTSQMYSTEYSKQIGAPNGVGFQYTGMPYAVIGGREYGGASNEWLSYTSIIYSDAKQSSSKVYEPYTYSNTQQVYDPNSKNLIKTISHFNTLSTDGLGNVKVTLDKTVDAINGTESKKTSSSLYASENTSQWHIGRLTSSTVTHTLTSKPSITRKATFTYNSKGLLDKEIANVGTNQALTKTYTYDTHGNKKTERISGSGISTATTTFGYDSAGKFQTSIKDAAGLEITKTYDARFGTIKTLRDANANITRWEYDKLGRKTKESRPDGTNTTWNHEWVENSNNFISANHALYTVGVQSSGQPFSRTYFDELARDVGSYTYSIRTASRPSPYDRRVSSKKEYNTKGELTKEELLHYRNQPVGSINTEYDTYGRVDKVTKTGPHNQNQIYTTTYSNFTQTVTDPKSVKKTTVKNAQDQTISITDASNKSEASTITYSYDSAGNLLTTRDSGSNVITMRYDATGNKTYMNDPDLGVWNYAYNALGNLKNQWSGTSGYNYSKHSSYKNYDILGRVTRDMSYNRVEYNSNTGTYSYNQTNYLYGTSTASKGSKGQLTRTTSSSRVRGQSAKSQTINTTYDSLGRAKQSSTAMTGRPAYIAKTNYDRYSRPSTMTYPNNYSTTNHYQNGILDKVIGSEGKVHYQVKGLNAYGEISDATFANGVRTAIGHDTAGYIGSILSGQNNAYYTGNVQQVRYTYDTLGNVKTRKDTSITNKYINETFTYDNMNRLYSLRTSSNVVGAYTKNKDYRYDKLGNMTYQTGLGTYQYTYAKPHALSHAGSRRYYYDTVGNMTTRNGDTITYNPINKPSSMRKSGASTSNIVHFTYGAGGQRYLKQVGNKKTYYLGKGYEEHINGNETKQIAYIQLGGKTIGTHTVILDTDYVTTNSHYVEATYNRYFHTDALGSITSITNDVGTVVERRSYAPFGKIRAMDYGTNNNYSIANKVIESNRAFTGHEQVEELSGLIHMNARVYDSDIGRFLSADTIIQDPHDSQSYNRYSYVRNNPLAYTDPTGNSWWTKFRDKWVVPIVAVVAGILVAIYAPQFLSTYFNIATGTLGSVVATGALAGAVGGAIMTGTLEGTLKGAVFGAISAGIANGIGAVGENIATSWGAGAAKVSRALLHAISRSAITKAQGGKWSAGFWSGFASSALAPLSSSAETTTGKVAMSAIVGGTVSELGGGKFANGAVTGAFVMMFNDALHSSYPSKNSMYKMSQSKWKMGEKGMFRTLMVNGADTGRVSSFNPYGASVGNRFFAGLGNGVVSGVHFIGRHGDVIGLALSVGAMATPGGWGYAMGAAAIGIDIGQGDLLGTVIGSGAMYSNNPAVGMVDIVYGVIQAW